VEFFQLNPVCGGPTHSPTLGREFITVFPPTPPHSTPGQHSPSSNDSVPSLWSVTDSEEDEGKEEFLDAVDGSVSETVISSDGSEEGYPVFAGGLGGDAWELFSRTGVREDSL
jgi:hypothetical protein